MGRAPAGHGGPEKVYLEGGPSHAQAPRNGDLKLALSPNDGQTFLKEVDDELRKERVNSFVARFGWWIIAGVLLLLGAVGGYLWWSGSRVAAREAAGESLIETLRQLETGTAPNRAAAAPKIAALAQNDTEGYRAAALFARANSETQAGNMTAAIATLRSIADDQSLDELYRQAAQVRRTALEYDRLAPQEVIRRLGPLTGAGSAWLGSAGEMVGVAHLKMNRPDLAGPIFVRIAREESVPDPIRARAGHMAGSLGFDTNPAAREAAPARPAAPAAPATPAPATREKAR
jgi:hypothetical protein